MSQTPTITLHPATESDLPALVALQYLCFIPHLLIETIMHPDTFSSRQAMVEKHLLESREDKGIKIVKAVVHTPPGPSETVTKEEIVGFCIFHYPMKVEDVGETWINPLPLRPVFTHTDPTALHDEVAIIKPSITAAQMALFAQERTIPLSRTNTATFLPQRRHVINSYIALHSLPSSPTLPLPLGYVRYMCVHPSYRRHGIGSQIMRWGCERYDEMGVDAFLDATVEGEWLYRRFGFEGVGELVLEVYGEVEGVSEGESGSAEREVVGRETYVSMWRRARGGG